MEDFKIFLKSIHFSEYLEKIIKKFKNKKIVIYGSGSFFKYISDNFDLSKLNIIGISDMKFDASQEGQDYLGFKMIPKDKIISYKPDIVLVATLKYIGIIEDFETNLFKNTKIRVYPLARLPFWQLVKEIWGQSAI